MAGQDWDPFADPADTGAEITKCVVEDFQPGGRAKLTRRHWWKVSRASDKKQFGPFRKHQVFRCQSLEQAELNGCPNVTGHEMFDDVWQGLLRECILDDILIYTSSTGERCQVHLQHKARFWHGPAADQCCAICCQVAGQGAGLYFLTRYMGGIWWYNPARLGGYHCFLFKKK